MRGQPWRRMSRHGKPPAADAESAAACGACSGWPTACCLAALVFVAATHFKASHPLLPYIAAFAEAAMVGALADWFAVVALFRHPLGLRFIPHTAIIPANKDRIATNLGAFIQGEFFATERVLHVIREFDPAGKIAGWFAQKANARRFGDIVVRGFAYALDALGDDEVRHYLRRAVSANMARFDLAQLAGNVLDVLTLDNRHQALLDQLLEGIEAALAKPEVRERIEVMLANELPLYFERLKLAGGRIAAEKIAAGILQLLQEISADPQHQLRLDFNRMVANLIQKLKSDPAYRFRIEQFQQQLAADPRLSDYCTGYGRISGAGCNRTWSAPIPARAPRSSRSRAIWRSPCVTTARCGSGSMRRSCWRRRRWSRNTGHASAASSPPRCASGRTRKSSTSWN